MKHEAIRPAVLAVLRQFSAEGYAPTAAGLAAAVGHPLAAATVTAKLRDLRKERYGGHRISCWRCPEEEHGSGYVYRYRLEVA